MKKIIIFLMSLILATTVCMANVNKEYTPTEQTESTEKWVEIEAVVIPFNIEVHEGVTKNGNPKYWFVFNQIGTVSLSASNYKKYVNKTDYIELVKWQKGNKYKYTTRLKSKANVNLNSIFK